MINLPNLDNFKPNCPDGDPLKNQKIRAPASLVCMLNSLPGGFLPSGFNLAGLKDKISGTLLFRALDIETPR